MDYSIYDKYLAVYNLIRKENFLTVYATGAILDFDFKSFDLKYNRLYVEVLPGNFSPENSLEELPAGHYLCVNFFPKNKEAQLKKLADSLEQLNVTPKLILQADTFYDVTNYKNPLVEIQCLIDEESSK